MIFKRKPKTPESHEAMLLSIKTYDFLRKQSVPLFKKTENGDVSVSGAGYFISKELWQQRVEEFKHPNKSHDFAWTGLAEGGQWPRQHAQCRTCGEQRKVSMFVDVEQVNRGGWCK